MKLTSKLILLLFTVSLIGCSPKEDKTLQISGTVIDTETKSIILVKPGQDPRFDSIIEIPVLEGKFNYEAKLQHPEAVHLFFGEMRERGGGRHMQLYLENEKIDLTIYPEEEFDKNIVEGGTLNAEYKKFIEGYDAKFKKRLQPLRDSMDLLFERCEYSSDEMNEIIAALNNAKSQDEKVPLFRKMEQLREKGLDMTPAAKEISDQQNIIYEEAKKYQEHYISTLPNLVSYSFLLMDLQFSKESIDIDLTKENYRKLSEAHPNHPYNELTLNLITAIDGVKIGNQFVDFSAPNLEGNEIKLSDEIEGKVALLDLWATWCGPCIAKSKTMIPLYEEFKDKGFTIVGVAGEFDNTDRLISFLEKEKWPWLQLVELDKQNSIWTKYGIDNSGGKIFLIDNAGKIIAMDPTTDEVRKELEDRLN